MGRKAGYSHTDQTKEKMRNKMYGRLVPDERRDKISRTMLRNFAQRRQNKVA